ncbi:NAD-dependent epimerase/dehydratase family protein [Aureimonas leprariae]|uniref:NAD-dependent epimerase/dehydratase family protein n=1 Tax=Plantimonas leprariae TaxID=2615207 RepID=A0A7V7TYE9_9HYPH|nr:NAD-dependent epimerase/dehydratase family protein [Aureimonas leprariae]KAB0677187.1 NAD-dependent epimerase/dehydratase family protein [Aureimonas leprariae]
MPDGGGGGRPLVALTGATGFLGIHLTAALDAAGFRVRALARNGRPVAGAAETVAGDLADAVALRRLVAGANAVVHAAGLTKARSAAEFDAVNAGGTARLLDGLGGAAPDAHVVLISSLAAREPQLSPYAASKRAGEREAGARVPEDRLAVVRPPALYGPHDRATLAVFRAARSGLCPLPGGDRGERIALLDGRDAADAVARLLKERRRGTFALADSRPGGYGMHEIFEAAARAQGRTARFVAIPAPAFRLLGRGGAVLGRLAGRAPLLSPGKVREMLHPDWSVDPADMPPGLAGSARSIGRGFAETVAWYRQAGWL